MATFGNPPGGFLCVYLIKSPAAGRKVLPAAVNRRGHPQLLGKEAVEMGCVVHTDAFRDLLAGKDAAV